MLVPSGSPFRLSGVSRNIPSWLPKSLILVPSSTSCIQVEVNCQKLDSGTPRLANTFLSPQYGYQVWLYICFAFWSADRFARLARIVYYNRIGDAKATVEAIPGCNVLQVTVFPRLIRGIVRASTHSCTSLSWAGCGKATHLVLRRGRHIKQCHTSPLRLSPNRRARSFIL